VERAEAEAIYEQGRDVVVAVLLRMDEQVRRLERRVAEQDERIAQLERRLSWIVPELPRQLGDR
jgi:transposase